MSVSGCFMVTGGPMLRGMFGTEEVGSGTDLWRYWDEFRAGRLDEESWCELESCFSRSSGHCMHKLKFQSLSELIRYAVRNQIITA